jgi:hypothetical protein
MTEVKKFSFFNVSKTWGAESLDANLDQILDRTQNRNSDSNTDRHQNDADPQH